MREGASSRRFVTRNPLDVPLVSMIVAIAASAQDDDGAAGSVLVDDLSCCVTRPTPTPSFARVLDERPRHSRTLHRQQEFGDAPHACLGPRRRHDPARPAKAPKHRGEPRGDLPDACL